MKALAGDESREVGDKATHTAPPVDNGGKLAKPLSSEEGVLLRGTGVPPTEDGSLKVTLEL